MVSRPRYLQVSVCEDEMVRGAAAPKGLITYAFALEVSYGPRIRLKAFGLKFGYKAVSLAS